VLAGVPGLGFSRFGMKLGGTRVRLRLFQVSLGALGIGFLRRPPLGLLLVSARMLLALARVQLAPPGGTSV
jgi:hypothetical protein